LTKTKALSNSKDLKDQAFQLAPLLLTHECVPASLLLGGPELPCNDLASLPKEVQELTTKCFIPQKLGYVLAPSVWDKVIQCRSLILTVLFGETIALTNSEEAMDAERMVSVLPRRNLRVEPVSYVGGL